MTPQDIAAFLEMVQNKDFAAIRRDALARVEKTNDPKRIAIVRKDLDEMTTRFKENEIVAGAYILASIAKVV